MNDVTALRGDPELAGVVADSGAYLCLMHMQGEPRTMQLEPRYDDVAGRRRGLPRGAARVRGRTRESPRSGSASIPGSASARRVAHNLELVRRLDVLLALGRPVLVGLSRKSMLGKILGDERATTGSAAASVGAAIAAFERGASIFRVHDVREHVEALAAAAAVSA